MTDSVEIETALDLTVEHIAHERRSSSAFGAGAALQRVPLLFRQANGKRGFHKNRLAMCKTLCKTSIRVVAYSPVDRSRDGKGPTASLCRLSSAQPKQAFYSAESNTPDRMSGGRTGHSPVFRFGNTPLNICYSVGVTIGRMNGGVGGGPPPRRRPARGQGRGPLPEPGGDWEGVPASGPGTNRVTFRLDALVDGARLAP